MCVALFLMIGRRSKEHRKCLHRCMLRFVKPQKRNYFGTWSRAIFWMVKKVQTQRGGKQVQSVLGWLPQLWRKPWWKKSDCRVSSLGGKVTLIWWWSWSTWASPIDSLVHCLHDPWWQSSRCCCCPCCSTRGEPCCWLCRTLRRSHCCCQCRCCC